MTGDEKGLDEEVKAIFASARELWKESDEERAENQRLFDLWMERYAARTSDPVVCGNRLKRWRLLAKMTEDGLAKLLNHEDVNAEWVKAYEGGAYSVGSEPYKLMNELIGGRVGDVHGLPEVVDCPKCKASLAADEIFPRIGWSLGRWSCHLKCPKCGFTCAWFSCID